MATIDLPPDIICLMAREAAYIKQFRQYNSPSDLAKAQAIRDDIDRRYWASFSIVSAK